MTNTFDEISPPQPVDLPLQFHGRTQDYFRLWVVNICLTLCTLGLFSAWAKVRKQRFLHAHTTLDGTPFEYLGHPVAILKGRLVAALFLLTYYGVSYVAPALNPFVLGAALVAAPWVLVRAAAFNAHYRAFRNIRFQFHGDYAGAVGVIYWLGAIPALVAGVLFQWWEDWRIMVAMFVLAGILFPAWMWRFRRYMVTMTSYGSRRGEFDASAWGFFRIYLVAGLILVVAAIASGVVIGAVGRGGSMGYALAAVPMFIGYLLALAHVQAHSANLVWRHTRIGPVRFRSGLRTFALAWLYLCNTAAIVLSCGLLLPWAVMRTMRYRIRNLHAESVGDLAVFRAERVATVQAQGAEISDLFEMDFAL